ncbi:hypothetical protein IJT17_07530 [bacterium]|nr:hypothetical protein [bacterium]
MTVETVEMNEWVRLLKTLAVAVCGLLIFCGAPVWAQGDAPAPDGVPSPVTDTALVLDSEAPTNKVNIESDIPDVTAAAAETRSSSSSGNGTTFLLIVVLGLFGFYLYNNQSTNERISRLEAALKGGAGSTRERDELVPFSWNSVLRSLEGGFPVLPGLVLPKPCLFLIGLEKPADAGSQDLAERRMQVTANMVRTVLRDPEMLVLAVLRHLGSCDLGRAILSQEGEHRWSDMTDDERQAMLRRCGKTLDRYEKSLYCLNDLVLTSTQLYRTCQELLSNGDLGAIILDDIAVLVPDEHFSEKEEQKSLLQREVCEALRLLAVRCHVPVCVIAEVGSDTWNELIRCEVCEAVTRLDWRDGQVRAAFTIGGEREAEKVWTYVAGIGTMVPASREEA